LEIDGRKAKEVELGKEGEGRARGNNTGEMMRRVFARDGVAESRSIEAVLQKQK